jgi:sterol desaturase/sphingolipid hydroxylase (fatty acid hydroxylase superfamily)
MVPLLTVERGFIGVGGFIVLLLAESVWPFKRLEESRWRRYAINLFIGGSNALLLSVLLGSLVISSYHSFELHRLGVLHRFGIGSWWNILLTIIVLDGMTYGWHRAYHGVPVMWRMHRVHHSDQGVDVTTSGRFHLTEMVLSAVFRLGVIALWGASVTSVVIFEIVFGLLNQLEHANLHIPEPLETWLRSIFVTPDMHRIHHSQAREHTNSNYSTIFSWWDRLFGTYRFGADQQTLTLGLPEHRQPQDVTFGKVLAMPFGPPCASALTPHSIGDASSRLS